MSTSTDIGSRLDPRAFLIAKTDQAVEILKERGIDVWLTYVRESMSNVDPCLELIFDGDLTWESAIIITAEGEKIAIVAVHDAPDIEESEIYHRVIGYREGISEPLVNTIVRLNPRSIAVNFSENDPLADGLGAGLLRLLRRRFENTIFGDRLVSAEDIIWSLRAQKLDMEVEAIRRSVRETEAILEEAANDIRIGMTARELADAIRNRARDRGYECAWTPQICPLVSTGPTSRIGHVSPTAEEIAPGSLVHVTFGIRLDGYCSDIQRVWYVSGSPGEPPEPVQRAFATIVAAIAKAAKALRPGRQGWEIDQIARDHLVGEGYEEYHHALGHQLGRAPHDGGGATLAPRWERYNETPYGKVEPGSVFTLEPTIILPEFGLVALEEVALVTEAGTTFLSEPQTELKVLALGSDD
jgi:Xaa-Pro aminopeptidase